MALTALLSTTLASGMIACSDMQDPSMPADVPTSTFARAGGDNDRIQSSAPVMQQGGSDASLRIAVDDGLVRLLPGLSAEVAGPIGAVLRDLDTRLKSAAAEPAALMTALTHADETLRRFASADGADRIMLDVLMLELSATTSR